MDESLFGLDRSVGYVLERLTADEWPVLQALGQLPEHMPDPEAIVLVVRRTSDRKIIGRWMAYNIVTLEGLQIDPEYRHRPGVVRRLFVGMMTALKQHKIPAAVTLIQDDYVRQLAAKVGFERLPGDVWQVKFIHE